MKLSEEDVDLFCKLSGAIVFYTKKKYPVIKDLKKPTFESIPPIQIKKSYDLLSAHIELIDSLVDENPFSFTDEELNVLKSWNNLISGKFLIMFHLKDFTTFVDVSNLSLIHI